MKKSKKILAEIIAVSLAVVGGTAIMPAEVIPSISITASAETENSGTCGANVTYILDNGTLTISGTGDMYDYAYYAYIPWYSERESIKEVIIEDGVTSIGYYAFWYCSGLTEITISDSVTSINDNAFVLCDRLTSINVSENNENYSSIDGVVFNKDETEIIKYPVGKTDLSYVIPDSVTSIGDSAFLNCNGLTEINIPYSVTSIGNGAFQGCSDLTEITIPDSVTSIGREIFYQCSGLAEITIPDSLTSIGRYAFNGTPWLEAKRKENPLVIVNGILIDGTTCSGDVVIPDSVTSIGECAFNLCKNLTSVTIPDSVTSIGSGAFQFCTGLTSVTIPDRVTSIDNEAFHYCINLTSVTIPDSVTSIGSGVFNLCTGLKEITILNPECKIYDREGTISNTATIYGYENSTAQAYAEEYNRTFVSLGEAPSLPLGNLNGDEYINSVDASIVLIEYAELSTNNPSTLTSAQKKAADVNADGQINAVDSTIISSYYAYLSTLQAGEEPVALTEYSPE